jgi:hypothetical protein
MSQFRVEKRRAEAEVTLASGESRRGCFFLSSSSAVHAGPERVKDVLNFESGFFPFETADPARMVFVNREQVVTVRLIGPREEPKRDSGYDVALPRNVEMRLSNRRVLRGVVRLYCPVGRDRLSDYARQTESFRYLETADGTLIVNSAYIVELSEMPS